MIASVVKLKEVEDDLRVLFDFRASSGALKLMVKPEGVDGAPVNAAIAKVCETYLPREQLLTVLINCAEREVACAKAAVLGQVQSGIEMMAAEKTVRAFTSQTVTQLFPEPMEPVNTFAQRGDQ